MDNSNINTGSFFWVWVDSTEELWVRCYSDIEHDISEKVGFSELCHKLLKDGRSELTKLIIEFQISVSEIGIEGIFRFNLVHKFVNKSSKFVLVFIGDNQVIQEKQDLACLRKECRNIVPF